MVNVRQEIKKGIKPTLVLDYLSKTHQSKTDKLNKKPIKSEEKETYHNRL